MTSLNKAQVLDYLNDYLFPVESVKGSDSIYKLTVNKEQYSFIQHWLKAEGIQTKRILAQSRPKLYWVYFSLSSRADL